MSAESNTASHYISRAIRRMDYKDAWSEVFDARCEHYLEHGICLEDAEEKARQDADEATNEYENGLADYLHDQWKDREYG